MFWQYLVTIVCSSLVVCASCNRGHYHVILHGDGDCPQDATSCHSLSYYTNHSTTHFRNNTIFTFAEGTHILEGQELFGISEVSNITFLGLGNIELGQHKTVLQSTVIIQCQGTTGFYFEGGINIYFQAITFRNCGGSDEGFAIGFSHTGSVTMRSVSIQNSTSVGLMLSESYDISIDKCSFFGNRGNMMYCNYLNMALGYTSIYVTRSNFTFGNRTGTSATAGGLGINVVQFQYSLNFKIYIEDAIFLHNVGGNLVLAVERVNSSIIHVNNVLSEGGVSEFIRGPALHLTPIASRVDANIYNSQFTNSGKKGAVFVDTEPARAKISFVNCSLRGNALPALVLSTSQYYGIVLLNVMLCNVTVAYNEHVLSQDGYQGALVLNNIPHSTLDGVSIMSNGLTGLLFTALMPSLVTFSGSNHFIGNHGDNNGGAIVMYGASSLAFDHDTTVHFTNNTAVGNGGAIFATTSSEDCFYEYRRFPDDQPHMFFSGNKANGAGDALYGGNVQNCRVHLFDVSGQDGLSIISSNATNVCFCPNGRPDCQLMQMNYTKAPGERFEVAVAVVGEGGGLTVGVVQFWSSQTKTLSNLVSTDQAGMCIKTVILANSTDVSVKHFDLLLTEDSSNTKTIHTAVTKCPTGFFLQNGMCDCNEQLVKLSESPKTTITCNITHQSVTRAGNVWIALDDDCVKASPDCPFDYCKFDSVTITTNNTNVQCNHMRTGLLCGECLDGYSLQLGSNKCKKCSNASLSLLILFSLAGIALVAFLIVLNLTVSMGTINGLVFYANVVKLYQSVFFQTQSIPLLSHFISWLNLDLDVEICFYSGMDACGKTWLQFAFPLYIWILIGAIIILANRSQRFTKLIGTNAIQVLATLILLSYTKLIRTVILSFYQDSIVCGSSTASVWRVNGSIEFLSGCHLPIFVFSLSVLVVVILPYTLLLLTFPLFEWHLVKYRLGRRLSFYLKPFFDAYGGPFKDRYRFWSGLLLVMRVVLALTVSVAGRGVATDVLSCAATALVSIHLVGGIYRSAWNAYLEVALILDLLLMSHVAGQIDAIPDSRRLGYNIVLLSFAFIVFLVVLLYHLLRRVVRGSTWRKVVCPRPKEKHAALNMEAMIVKQVDDVPAVSPSQTTVSVPPRASSDDEVIRCRRESLLFDNEYVQYAAAV